MCPNGCSRNPFYLYIILHKVIERIEIIHVCICLVFKRFLNTYVLDTVLCCIDIWTISFNPHNTLSRIILSLSSFYRNLSIREYFLKGTQPGFKPSHSITRPVWALITQLVPFNLHKSSIDDVRLTLKVREF